MAGRRAHRVEATATQATVPALSRVWRLLKRDGVAHHVPRDGDPDLPIKLRLASNGGVYPPMPGELALETARRTRAVADVQARRLGVSRRHFMLSAARSATMLATDLGPVPTDPEDAAVSTSTDECVFGVQGHFLADPEGTELPLPGFPQDECGQADPHGCYSAETFRDLTHSRDRPADRRRPKGSHLGWRQPGQRSVVQPGGLRPTRDGLSRTRLRVDWLITS